MPYKDYIPEYLPCSKALRTQVAEKISQLTLLSDDLPIFIIHELTSGDNNVIYMSPKGVAELGLTLDEVVVLGKKYYELYFNPDDVLDYLSKWNAFISEPSNKGAWYTYFQQVNVLAQEEPLWFLSVSTVIAYEEGTNKPLFSLTLPLRINQYLPIVPKLHKIIEENNFIRKNLSLFSTLTRKEKEILREMALGNNPKGIANNLYTAESTVRTHRRNIKKKLNIKNDAAIIYFARAFDLI